MLEAFVLYLTTVEDYARDLNQLVDDGKFPLDVVRAQIAENVQPVIDGRPPGIVGMNRVD